MDPTVTTTSKKKFLLWIIGMIITTSLIAFFTLAFLLLNRNTVYSQVYIEAVDVSELTKEDAIKKVKTIYEGELTGFKVNLTHENYNRQLAYKDLGYTYLYEDAVTEAYRLGREGNLVRRIREIYHYKNHPITIRLKSSYDEELLNQVLDTIEEDINQEPKNATIKRQKGTFHINKEVVGEVVERHILQEKIRSRIYNFSQEDISIPITYVVPEVTEEKLKNIREVIGEFSTTFNLQQVGRNHNIRIGANSIDGTLIMPGEEFSFNQQTGPRDVSGGYQEAPVIVDGQLEPGIGGGICQVSTTLYNAVVRGNLEITQRRNHSLPVGYVPLGHDATVFFNYIDFKFINNMESPIYIESFVTGDRLFTKIYGKREENIVINLTSEVVEVIEPKVEVKKDANLLLGEQIIEKEPKKGYRVNTYKIYTQNGREIKREHISRDYYTPVNGVIIEGTKPKPVAEAQTPEKPEKDNATEEKSVVEEESLIEEAIEGEEN
ncbi:VanW family protein [Natronincola ferrireducens]|uniref:Vancomycin resistance protein YoaR, contains peptidoglycan-binding and VanW domains n=1 Tax=Natronincola ferrireducens TaxID=393762 RepID=A0A1G9DZY4_9FIRM|nr:VanW family protein [Natronincola ferrireducens]SDK69425.1 Vancomycin resistance protein YoaR, contains peptidoglycan-binding and VanW domains [Natronincola ferrireducens]